MLMTPSLIIPNVTDLDLAQTLDCGQSFRWTAQSDGTYSGIAFGRRVTVALDGTDLIIGDAPKEDEALWRDYFDLGLDYGMVRRQISGLHPILYDTGNDSGLEQESIRNLLDTKAMGIILVPVAEDPDMIRRKTRNKVPVVFLGSKVRSSEVNYVCTDTAAGTELALRHLTHLGHREIVMLCDSKTSGSRSRRISVYRQIMQELGQEPRIFPIPPDEPDLSQAGYQLTRKLLSSGIRFTAIYACKDMLAIGAMGALTEAGIRIPEQVSVVGYDGIDAAALPMIRLTTVAQPRTEMAEQVIDMLCRHAEDLSLPPEHCLAAPQLILRSSTGPV